MSSESYNFGLNRKMTECAIRKNYRVINVFLNLGVELYTLMDKNVVEVKILQEKVGYYSE